MRGSWKAAANLLPIPATPLLEQRGTVHTYFDSMGNAIERAERHQQLR